MTISDIWKRLTKRSSIIFICGGLAAVSLRFLPELIYPDYQKQYLSLSDEEAFSLSQQRLLEPCVIGEKTAALAFQRILADKGYAPAQFAEGEMYRTGVRWQNAEGGKCPKNLVEARIWYKAAVRQKYQPAIEALEKLPISNTSSKRIVAPCSKMASGSKSGTETIHDMDVAKHVSQENFDSLFGVSLGKVYSSSSAPYFENGMGLAYSFVPAKIFLDFETYGCCLTPRSRKVVSVFAVKEEVSVHDAATTLKKVVDVIEKRYSATMADLRDEKVASDLRPIVKPFLKSMPKIGANDHLLAMWFIKDIDDKPNIRALFVCTVSNAVYIYGFDVDAIVLKGKESEQSAVDAL